MNDQSMMSRRRVLATGAFSALAAVLSQKTRAWAGAPLSATPVVAPARELPYAGVPATIVFDVGVRAEIHHGPRGIRQTLLVGAGALIDTADSYAHARERMAALAADLRLEDAFYLAIAPMCGAELGTAPQHATRIVNPGAGSGLWRVWNPRHECSYFGLSRNSDAQAAAILKLLARENAANRLYPRVFDAEAEAAPLLDLTPAPDEHALLRYLVVGATMLARAGGGVHPDADGGWSLVATFLK